MSMIKYRVHEVGKDFDVQSKVIMDILAKYATEPKNHMTTLTEKELDIIFESFTNEHIVSNFEDFFAAFKKAEEPQAAVEVKEAIEEKAPVATAQQAAKQPDSQAKPEQHQANQNVAAKPQAPFQKAPQKDNKKSFQQTVIEKRYVDTKTVSVDLAKYDDRIEGLVPDKAKDLGKQVQKLKKTVNNKPMGVKRDSEADKLRRLELEKIKKQPLNLTLPEELAVSDLASRLKVTNAEVVKKLILVGVMASASQIIDYDTAALIAEEFGAKVKKEVIVTIEDKLIDITEDEAGELQSRSPVVVVMGHVDHGKTSLLDAIRNTHVTDQEAGGITQHIGAYRVNVKGKEITFLDTPGHEAFTAMRARGAQVTDIAILVVAADDGIMPQTVEAINHAKAAKVSIIVAINKMDKPGANPDRVMQELTQHELVPEQWGGDVICVPVSAVKREGIDNLLDMVLLVSEMKELKANPDRSARGTVIEAKLDKGRGPVATVLVQNGTLNTSDCIIAGSVVGRVRAMTDDRGRSVKSAGPSVPVEIIGLSEVPGAGDIFYAVADERMARELAEQRKFTEKEKEFASNTKVSLEEFFSKKETGEVKDLNIIVKADVQGSVEAVRSSLEKLSDEEVRIKVIHGGVGAITESDIMLAFASNAIIVGFNVRPDAQARDSAERNKIDVRLYRIIYDCIEEMQAAMKGMLAPKFTENVLGHAQVRQVFRVTGVGAIAGCYVQDGKILRSAGVRIVRDGIVVVEGKISSLKRFKEDAKEVAEGYECGISIENYNDIKDGDIIEAFVMVEQK